MIDTPEIKKDCYGFEIIDVNRIQIPFNYVLIKLDGDHERYHNRETGEDTGLYVAPWGANQASHLGLTGIVVKTPEQLIFNGYQMATLKQYTETTSTDKEREIKSKEFAEYSRYKRSGVQKEIADLRRASMAYDVPMEVKEGDRVYFEYTTRLDAIKEGRRIETDEGVYILVPYDLLLMRFKPTTDFNNVQIPDVYMLNGLVLIRILEYATEVSAQGVRGYKTEMDLFLPEGKHPDAKYVHNGNVWYGTILSCGCGVKSYADFPGRGGEYGVQNTPGNKPGDKIMFDGRHKKRLEVEHHRVIFKKNILHRIHRKDILGWFPSGNINGLPKV